MDAAPHLTWTAKKDSAYYNVQIFRSGQRVLIAWPSRASYNVPKGKLAPGDVRLVRVAGGQERRRLTEFADLIGRSTFVVKA